jgi:hypothetical protein
MLPWDDPFTRSSRVNPKGTAAKSGRAGHPLSDDEIESRRKLRGALGQRDGICG